MKNYEQVMEEIKDRKYLVELVKFAERKGYDGMNAIRFAIAVANKHMNDDIKGMIIERETVDIEF